jgi:hypothetical protein
MTKWFGENIHPIVNSTVQHIHIQYDRMKYISPIFKVDQSGVFGVFEIPAGTSGVEKGVVPATNLELAWNTWDDMASSSGMSRLYGGIHCLTAHTSSQTVASIVNSKIETTWNISASV